MPPLMVTAQGTGGLSLWEAAALFLGVPAVLFLVIALLVLRFAPRREIRPFPVLRSGADAVVSPPAAEPALPQAVLPPMSVPPERLQRDADTEGPLPLPPARPDATS